MRAPLSTGMACCEEKVEMLDDGNIATKSASNAVCLFSAGINECFPLSRRAVAMQPMWLQKGQIPFFAVFAGSDALQAPSMENVFHVRPDFKL